MAEGLARAGFDIDLKDGKAREQAFARILQQGSVHRSTIEHKCDEVARRTGNVFVEFRQHGRPSGIATTRAHWWAVEFDDDCWFIIPTSRMKHLARRAWLEGRKKKGGDYGKYEGVLVPLKWIFGID